MDWHSTHTGRLYPPPRSLNVTSIIRRCSAAVIHDGYVIRLGAFVLFRQSNRLEPSVGRVEEIVADAQAKRLMGILIQEFQVGEVVLPYRFPALIRSPQSPILCTIKVCI